ncbi:MAG TPA: DoxX family protein [Flavipsychrobacter sp.]|nr:DoxX family protein [Flavipsychrobacter sp.]
MKVQKSIYWVTTVIFCLWMLLNAYFYLTSEEAKQICRHFGFPDYFREELAFAKIAGVVVLLLPPLKGSIREWAYSGFAITVVSGFIAHVCSRDGLRSLSSALLALAILLASYFSYHSLKPIRK